MLSPLIQQLLRQQYPMLDGLASEAQQQLWSQAQRVSLPVGTVTFDEEQPCRGFPLILSGEVKVSKLAPSGRELVLYRVGQGESCILSSSCLLGHASYHARGVVEHALDMVVLPPALFRMLLASHEPFRDYVFALFSERMSDLMQLVSVVAFQKLDQRLAALLVSRASPLRITHQQLADELGSVREMVSRLLKQFADQGWLRLGREQIEILSPTDLAQYAQSGFV